MSSRRRNFCFLNLLNLALSPFCDDICPRSSNLFVTQRAEDKPVRSSIRHATDGRCEAHTRRRCNEFLLNVPIARLAPCNVLRHARSILYFSTMSLRTRKLDPTQRPVARFPRNGDLSKFASNSPRWGLFGHNGITSGLSVTREESNGTDVRPNEVRRNDRRDAGTWTPALREVRQWEIALQKGWCEVREFQTEVRIERLGKAELTASPSNMLVVLMQVSVREPRSYGRLS
jgi:hypothetical protein